MTLFDVNTVHPYFLIMKIVYERVDTLLDIKVFLHNKVLSILLKNPIKFDLIDNKYHLEIIPSFSLKGYNPESIFHEVKPSEILNVYDLNEIPLDKFNLLNHVKLNTQFKIDYDNTVSWYNYDLKLTMLDLGEKSIFDIHDSGFSQENVNW